MAATESEDDLDFMTDAAREAGEVAMRYFRSENRTWLKKGDSPVSEADYEVDRLLRETFRAGRPDYGWLSEETTDTKARLDTDRLVIVDPIDGTRGFLKGDPRWCISIAVVEGSKPVEAVLFCPALGEMFRASRGKGLLTEQVEAGNAPSGSRPLVTGSKKMIERLNDLPNRPFDVAGFVPSLAYRLAMVASRQLDAAFAWPGASEWDIAAADLLLAESGCILTTRSGKQIDYNRENVKAPGLVAARVDNHGEILALAESSGILH